MASECLCTSVCCSILFCIAHLLSKLYLLASLDHLGSVKATNEATPAVQLSMLCTFAQACPTDVLHLPSILHVLCVDVCCNLCRWHVKSGQVRCGLT